MIPPTHLRPEDEPEFEQLVHQALRSADIHRAVCRAAGDVITRHLRDQAMAERHTIAAAAAVEYQAYLEQCGAAGAESRKVLTGSTPPTGRHGFLAAVVVLTPVLSSIAAALFLALGYGTSLGSPGNALADALIGAGRTAVVVALVSTAVGVACLLFTAAHHRSSPPETAWDREAEAWRLRESWRQALLTRGIHPFLHDRLRQPHPAPVPEPAGPSPAARPDPSPTGPGHTSPGFSGPRHPAPSA
ncbi:hypothetical protein ACLIYP_26215 [Streptomyces nanhaiensis]|uniref:hypothetical protein n=1 Tax=Streptomyces nanhaiensis TaxID=679319 RepID=UPI00399D548D